MLKTGPKKAEAIQLSASLEDYLETIAALIEEHGHAHTSDIAERMKVKMPSVTFALGTLSRGGYVDYRPNQPVMLTGAGIAMAERVRRKHRVLEDFFHELLGLPAGISGEAACRIEHVVDGNTASRMQIISGAIRHRNDCRALRNYLEEAFEFLGYAEREVGTVLPALPVGKHATVLKLGANIAEPQRLEAQGLTVGATVTVERLLPEVNRCVCRVDGRECDLSLDDAENIWIDPAGS